MTITAGSEPTNNTITLADFTADDAGLEAFFLVLWLNAKDGADAVAKAMAKHGVECTGTQVNHKRQNLRNQKDPTTGKKVYTPKDLPPLGRAPGVKSKRHTNMAARLAKLRAEAKGG